jgi:hypothetical protein
MWRDGEAELMMAVGQPIFHRFEADLQHLPRTDGESVFEQMSRSVRDFAKRRL